MVGQRVRPLDQITLKEHLFGHVAGEQRRLRGSCVPDGIHLRGKPQLRALPYRRATPGQNGFELELLDNC